jgi:hypothetical protein
MLNALGSLRLPFIAGCAACVILSLLVASYLSDSSNFFRDVFPVFSILSVCSVTILYAVVRALVQKQKGLD